MTTLSFATIGTSAQAAAEPARLKLWRHETANIAEIDVSKAAVERFNQSQQRWKIEVEMIPEGSYTETVTAAALANDLPCVLDMDQPVVPNFAWSGYLRPLKGLVSQEVLDSLIESAKGTYKDDIYSVGQFEVALALFSRHSILKEHGIRIATTEQPWTKEEFLQALATLKASGKFAYPLDMRTGWKGEWYSYGYAPMLQSFGADQIDRSDYRTVEGVLNGKQAIAWGEFFQNLFAEGYVDRNPSDDKAFSQGRAALDYVGSWEMANHVTSFGDDLAVMPVPDFGSGPVVGGGSWHWGITQSCAHPEGAAAFLDYILQPNEIAAMSEATGMIPSTPAAAELTEHYRTGGDWRFFYDYSAAYAKLRPATPAYPIISSTFETMLRNIKDGADVLDSLDQAVDTIERNISDNKGYGFN
ncbi:sugar ABC transporter substrate-binding protein [Marinobacterium aestuarii]|nr:extracellular solute-binding protein [Marinobacterium aestuarii]